MSRPLVHWNALSFRAMREEDLPRIMDIEPRAYTFHWTEKIFRDCLSHDYIMPVLEQDGLVIGYAVYSIVASESHLLNITIEPEYMGRGLGRVLLNYIVDDCRERGGESLFLEVRPSNQAANRLYESMGFVELGIRKDYYPSHFGREDGRVMGLALVEGGL